MHIKALRCSKMLLTVLWAYVSVCVCVFVWDNGNPLMPKSDFVQAFWCIISLLPPVKNFDEHPEEKTLIACTYCANNGIVLETSPPSHLLLFQSHMQAVFHLSLLSSSVACDCWDPCCWEPAPPPLGGSGAICTSRLDDAHSHWHTRDGGWWMLCLYNIFAQYIWYDSWVLMSEEDTVTTHLDGVKQHSSRLEKWNRHLKFRATMSRIVRDYSISLC